MKKGIFAIFIASFITILCCAFPSLLIYFALVISFLFLDDYRISLILLVFISFIFFYFKKRNKTCNNKKNCGIK